MKFCLPIVSTLFFGHNVAAVDHDVENDPAGGFIRLRKRQGAGNKNTNSNSTSTLTGVESETSLYESRIVGGQNANKMAYPWFAEGLTRREPNKPYHVCGGSLVTREFVLTAAHCAAEFEKWKYYGFGIGSWCKDHDDDSCIGESGVDYKAYSFKKDDVYIHPAYKGSEDRFAHDFALVKLNGTTTIEPVTVNPHPVTTFTYKLWTAGFGVTIYNEDNPQQPAILREVEVTYMDQEKCSEKVVGLTSNMMCTSDIGKGPFLGDSGGPLYDKTNNKLVGVVSHGNVDGSPPAIYARISDQWDKWIKPKICQEHTLPKPGFCGDNGSITTHYAFQTYHGKYLRFFDNGIVDQADILNDWEQFEIVTDHSYDTPLVAVKSTAHAERYLRFDQDRYKVDQQNFINSYELFKIEYMVDSRQIALKSNEFGTYLSAKRGTFIQRYRLGNFGKFKLIDINRCALKNTNTGEYLSADTQPRDYPGMKTSATIGNSEKFQLIQYESYTAVKISQYDTYLRFGDNGNDVNQQNHIGAWERFDIEGDSGVHGTFYLRNQEFNRYLRVGTIGDVNTQNRAESYEAFTCVQV